MTIDHDLATTLRELAAVQRWVDHCTRDARSPIGAMQGPQGDAEPSRAPVDAADDRDAEWRPARALQRLLWTLSPTAQHTLAALAALMPIVAGIGASSWPQRARSRCWRRSR